MKTSTILLLSKGFIIVSALSLLSVSIMAINNPQAVMDLVQVQLTNTDAISSIRGVYGGVGLTIFISLMYLFKSNIKLALAFLSILWGTYAASRIITIFTEGTLGAFGTRWLTIECILFIAGVSLHRLTLTSTTNLSAK